MRWSEVLRNKEKLIENKNKLGNTKRMNYEHEIGHHVKITHEKST